MKEYQDLIEEYSSEAYSIGSFTVPIAEWGDKKEAKKYLKKYWLPKKEYENFWKPIQNKIFINQEKGLPDLIFTNQFEMIPLRGGYLFSKEDFNQLKDCIGQIGDKYFVIIENSFGGKIGGTPIKMKYPANTDWDELISGNFISSTIVDNSMKEYFVFSESGVWGKYAANDADLPLDIIGFKAEYSPIFIKKFQQSNDEWDEIKEWLPENYRKRMNL